MYKFLIISAVIILLVNEIVDTRNDVADIETFAGEDRDAVVGPLTCIERLIARRFERRDRELGVFNLGFLQANNVGLVGGKPIDQPSEPHVQRIHVPACELHVRAALCG